MARRPVVVASAFHFVAAPGVVVGIVPWLITGWETGDPIWGIPARAFGGALVVGGVFVVAMEFVRFVREGDGSPAPLLPTEKLVTGGLYRYVRNPMYVAVVGAIVGEALFLSRPLLLVYASAIATVVATFVHAYEEPILARTFGDHYDQYRASVPRWWPRLRVRRP